MEKSLKILTLAGWYPNEEDPQLGIFIKHQLEAIATQHEVTLVLLRPSRGIPRKNISNENGVRVIRYTYVKNQYPSKFLSWYVKWMSIVEEIGKQNFDLIHQHIIYPLAVPGLAFKAELNIPLVTSEQWSGYRNTHEYKGIIRKWYTRRLIKRSSAIVVLSSYLEGIMRQNGLDGNYFRIPNLVKLHGNVGHREQDGKVCVMHIGDHVDSDKNISGLLRAFKKASDKNPDLYLVQIGDGPDRDKLHKLCNTLEIQNRVTWVGRITQPEVVEYIQKKCDIGVVNSFVETFSVVAFEFLACGKPLIVSKCGGPEDYLPKGFGLKIPVGDDISLEKALLKLSFEYSSHKGETIREQVIKEFSVEVFLEKMNRVYQSVLK